MHKIGKKYLLKFCEKMLDKMLGLWYNGISGPLGRGRPANFTPYSGFCQVGIMHKKGGF
jgi:hypothetical protein